MDATVRRLRTLWYAAAYGGPLGLAAVAWGTTSYGLIGEPVSGLEPLLAMLWPVVACTAVIATAFTIFLRRVALEPARIANMELPEANAASPASRAQIRVQTAMFIVLGPIDAFPLILIGLTFALHRPELLGPAVGYALLAGRLAQPDFRRLLKETEAELVRADGVR